MQDLSNYSLVQKCLKNLPSDWRRYKMCQNPGSCPMEQGRSSNFWKPRCWEDQSLPQHCTTSLEPWNQARCPTHHPISEPRKLPNLVKPENPPELRQATCWTWLKLLLEHNPYATGTSSMEPGALSRATQATPKLIWAEDPEFALLGKIAQIATTQEK